MRSTTLALLLATLSACPGDPSTTADPQTTTGGSSEGSTLAPTSATTATSTGEDPTTSAGPPTSASSGPASTSASDDTGDAATGSAGTTGTTGEPPATGGCTGGSTGETTGGAGGLVIAVFDAYLNADCEPPAEADPVWGNFYVQFDNTAGAAETSATLVSASLSLADADPPVLEPIALSIDASGPIPAGELIEQKITKLPGVAHSACDHCDEFYALELEYDENGTIHHVVEDVTVPCSP